MTTAPFFKVVLGMSEHMTFVELVACYGLTSFLFFYVAHLMMQEFDL